VEDSIKADPRMETDEAQQRNNGLWRVFRQMLERHAAT
jgi:hypothetical protein